MDPMTVILDALDSPEARRAPHVAAVAQVVLDALRTAQIITDQET
jgi:hypothetical protein